MYQMEMDRKLPSPQSIGAVRNLFIGSMIVSSMAVVLLITVLPIMLGRLDSLYDVVKNEKSAFHRASKAMDEQIAQLLEPVSLKKLRLRRQVDFLDKLERKSFKGRMRMMNKVENFPPQQFDKAQFVASPLQVFDRQMPKHTSEMRGHILSQLRALSDPVSTVRDSKDTLQARFNPKCPRGSKGVRGVRGQDGVAGKKGENGRAGMSFMETEKIKQKCIVCPMGLPGARGKTGKVGLIGKQGYSYNVGLPGEIGDPGPVGLIGKQGADGEDGRNAIRYVPVRGPKGQIGDQGRRGLNAIPGMRGEIGDTNYQRGDQGLNGLIGIPGPRGDIGVRGETPFCECPNRSPNMGAEKLNNVISYYPFYRIL